jgi:hypothetical protein
MKNKEAFIKSYNETGKGTSNKISCTKCDAEVTAFGSNLENKIKKAGSLEILLDTFVCRSCKSASMPKKEKKISVRLMKRKKKEEIKSYVIPKMKWSVPKNTFLKDEPELIEDITKFSCVAPALFLNNARACHGCTFWSNCQCPLKTANEFACK